MPRQLFLRLSRPQIDAEALAAAREFLAAGIPPAARGRSGEGPFVALPDLDDAPHLATALGWHAPAALLQWDWLRDIGHSARGHRPVNALLFRAYLDAVGLDEPALALAAQYRALLSAAGVPVPDGAALAEEAFLVPCAALSLSCFPMEDFDAILGFSQAHCRQGSEWLDWLQRQLSRHGLPLGYVRRHRALLQRYAERLDEAAIGAGQGVAAGWALYEQAHRASAAALRAALAQPPERRAEAMLREKLPYAVGHHGAIMLEQRSLDEWLRAGDLPALRRALLDSPYVRADALDDSRLFKAAEFGGSMFGVFSAEDLALLRCWLRGDGAEPPALAETAPGRDRERPAAQRRRRPLLPVGGPSARELYHQLLNRAAYPDSLSVAAGYADKVLAWTRLAAPLQRGLRRRFPYSPGAFKQRVDAIHRREVERYRPLRGRPKLPREMYLWGIGQMAPAILADGCWLEHAAGNEPMADGVRRRLLRTFADEAGAGCIEWNHPNVYRRLLESLDMSFAPIDSQAFIQDSRLSDSAFVIPAYLLAVGQWPECFFPELLGLNLAIELSGLGATYMHLVDALRYHGIDPTIVQLHLSIDNLACGHAALAREAVELYLERMRSLGGEVVMQPAWERVWNGYLSLSTASLPFALSGLRRYGRWKIGEKARGLCHALRPS
ncbi:iron-containing redox enzyme family protein [Methylogaea oryzae]|nr:iron-containing redox enzyme family protein [Methylogaea oryzae]